MENIHQLVDAASRGSSWFYELLDSDNRIIATRRQGQGKTFLDDPTVAVDHVEEYGTPGGHGFTTGGDGKGQEYLVGFARAANHVSGDFFQYFPRAQERWALYLADVTGHDMDAAMPLVQFSGILQAEMRHEPQLDDLFKNLNQTLHQILDPQPA